MFRVYAWGLTLLATRACSYEAPRYDTELAYVSIREHEAQRYDVQVACRTPSTDR